MLERGPEPGLAGIPSLGAEHAGSTDRTRCRSRPSRRTMPRCGWPPAGDIAEIFGDPGEKGNFVIGYTREQGHPVCIDLDKFVQRSAGVFGATGTGKSFLTRIVLAGLMQHNQASVLVFDMHNEYGFDDTASDTGLRVIGLKTKFASRIRVVGLGAGTTIRGTTPDFNLEIAMRDIYPGGYRTADPRAEPEGDHPHHPACPDDLLRQRLVPALQGHEPGRDRGRG